MARHAGDADRSGRLRKQLKKPLAALFREHGGAVTSLASPDIGCGILITGQAYGKAVTLPINSKDMIRARGRIPELLAIAASRLLQLKQLHELERQDEERTADPQPERAGDEDRSEAP